MDTVTVGQQVTWLPKGARLNRTGHVIALHDSPKGQFASVQRRETTRTGGSLVRVHLVFVRSLRPATR